MDEGPGRVATGRGDGQHVVVLAPLDDDGDGLAVDGRPGGVGQPVPAGRRQHRQLGADPLDPLVVGDERHEVGLEEVPVVVGVLLGAQRVRAPVALVPVAGLLAHDLAGLEQVDLPAGLVLDGPAERAHRVEVLDLAAGAERLARAVHADVGVDAHRALLHLGVGRADGDEDRPQLVDVLPGLLGAADVGPADDLDERHAGPVEVDQRGVAAVDPAAAAADVRRLAGVLLEVRPLDADPRCRREGRASRRR